MKQLLTSMWREDEGQDLAEYALLLALLTVAIAAAVIAMRGPIQGAFTNAKTALQN